MAPLSSWRGTELSDSSFSSQHSSSSDQSRSTAPTRYSTRPYLTQHENSASKTGNIQDGFFPDVTFDPRVSSETYASTVPSFEDFHDDLPEYEIPQHDAKAFETDAIASTPPAFAELFPSTRRLRIRHDDSTMDGNMNLRIDTEVPTSGSRSLDLTLFHLRMHDLKNRDFSLRRYCRESGREVCHSSRKFEQPIVQRRPTLQRSMSNALASLRSKSETATLTISALKRHDSGYDSMLSTDEDESTLNSSRKSDSGKTVPTNTIKMEFSNYAHVDVKRRGAKTSKRYDFEYWGIQYAWKRAVRKDGTFKEVSYHLMNSDQGKAIAHIVPEPLTTAQAQEEFAKGGWVPPCSMWISDERITGGLTDVADVIVATGLIALVDDCIKRCFHRKRAVQLVLPMPTRASLKMNMEYIGPKKLIDEVFNRRTPASKRHLTPLRHMSFNA
ncbi:MAG: hypothetical protein M1836_006627 [Candelina mexicana]|nr:MAG: hypothetical protein M1836_006627 [Candelina mexicana]